MRVVLVWWFVTILVTYCRLKLCGIMMQLTLIMEARTVRDGVQYAVDHHFQYVDIETDAKEMINLM